MSGPQHLWHIDGNHRCGTVFFLIDSYLYFSYRWRLVIHGLYIYSRMVVYLKCADNNRAATVLEAATCEFGIPSRVRADRGGGGGGGGGGVRTLV